MTFFRRVGALSVLTLLSWVCAGRSPSPPVDEERFVEIYVRVERLNRTCAGSPDSLRAARERFLGSEGMSPKDLERVIAWYRDHPERAARALEKITGRLETERQAHRTPMDTTRDKGKR